MGLFKRLRDKYFDYTIVNTYLEQIAPGEYRTKHIKKIHAKEKIKGHSSDRVGRAPGLYPVCRRFDSCCPYFGVFVAIVHRVTIN